MGTHLIAAVVGYRPKNVGYFLLSLHRVRFNGVLHLITDFHTSSQFAAICDTLGLRCQVHPVYRPRSVSENRLCRLLLLGPIPPQTILRLQTRLWFRQILEKSLPVCCLRYIIAKRILVDVLRVSADSWHDNFLLSDSRDVYFQESPESLIDYVGPQQLLLAIEPRVMTESDLTFKWIVDIYGSSVARRFLGLDVSCSGTTFGDALAIRRYLNAMVEHIAKYRRRISHTVGYDQGIHNFLWRSGSLGKVVESHNNRGPIYTGWSICRVSSSGLILNDDGTTVTIVHQFDRKIERFRQLEFLRHIDLRAKDMFDKANTE